MSQSKRKSLVEALVNQVSGFVLSVLIFQYIIGPYLLGIEPNWIHNINITIIFTVVSVIRSYFVRRLFNKWGS